MEAKDTVMKYEQAESFDDEVEKKYKEDKGYWGSDWAFTFEDRQAIKSKMKWGKLEAQAEISFPLGKQEGRKEVANWINAHVRDERIKLITNFLPISEIDWRAKLKEWELE